MRDVGLSVCGPPEGPTDAHLPLDIARDLRPGADTEGCRGDTLPDIDIRVADNAQVGTVRPARDLLGDPRFLRSGHQVVDEHPVAALSVRWRLGEQLVEQVDALQVLHNHPLNAQIGPPHLLDEFGVMTPLYENPAG